MTRTCGAPSSTSDGGSALARRCVDSRGVRLEVVEGARPRSPATTPSAGPVGLPRQQRAVIVLRYYEDLTEAQTAEVLGCTVGTVKSHASRALGALRVAVQEVER